MKFDHKAVNKPRLLNLTGMAGSRQNLQLAIRYARLEREGALMGAVLAPGENYRRTGDALMMAVRIGLLESFELVEDRLHIGELVAFGEKVREEMRQRCRTKRRAQILERVCPAIVYAVGRIGIDPPLGKFLGGGCNRCPTTRARPSCPGAGGTCRERSPIRPNSRPGSRSRRAAHRLSLPNRPGPCRRRSGRDRLWASGHIPGCRWQCSGTKLTGAPSEKSSTTGPSGWDGQKRSPAPYVPSVHSKAVREYSSP